MMKMKYFLIAFLYVMQVSAQELKYYRYDSDFPGKEFHKGRRAALLEKMPGNSVAILFAAPVRNKSNDVDYTYHQDPNFYYLTGFMEPNSMLLLFKSEQRINGISSEEFLFVPERNPEEEQWTGRMTGKEGAKELTGIDGVFLASQFDSMQITFDKFDMVLYSIPNGVVDSKSEPNDLADLIESFKMKCS
jgi:Xaa-Pro aminopeptidase